MRALILYEEAAATDQDRIRRINNAPIEYMRGNSVGRKKEQTSVAKGDVASLIDLAEYHHDAVVSRTIIDRKAGTVTFFAFDAGQGLSEHSAPFDALVYLLEGESEITISGKPARVRKGEMIIIPANEPHKVNALTRFKMVLTMIHS